MNYFNHKNVQLAYEAVYNQDLCESMEDLGLIDNYDYLDEGESPYRKIVGSSTNAAGQRVRWTTQATPSGTTYIDGKPQPRLQPRQAKVNPKKPKMEAYELYDALLEYLLDEGYADTLGSAEIILENMSDEWLDVMVEEAKFRMVKDPETGKMKKVEIKPRTRRPSSSQLGAEVHPGKKSSVDEYLEATKPNPHSRMSPQSPFGPYGTAASAAMQNVINRLEAQEARNREIERRRH